MRMVLRKGLSILLEENATCALRWRNPYNIGAAGAHVGARDRVQALVETDFHCRQIIVTAAQSHARLRDSRIARGEQVENLVGWHRNLGREIAEFWRNLHRVESTARIREEGVRAQSGTGSVRGPLVLQKAGVWIDVAVSAGVRRTWAIGAVLWIRSVVVLRPEAMQDEGWMCRAFLRIWVGVTELRRPRQIQ